MCRVEMALGDHPQVARGSRRRIPMSASVQTVEAPTTDAPASRAALEVVLGPDARQAWRNRDQRALGNVFVHRPQQLGIGVQGPSVLD